MKHIQTIFFALALALSPLAYASTYYASPNGNGNGNSYATPCSFSDGLKKLSLPGDTLYLLGGQYDLGNTKLPSISGDATANIVPVTPENWLFWISAPPLTEREDYS